MNEKLIFDIQMFSEGAEGSEGGSESGLTGDFETDYNKYVLGKESAPVSREENAEETEAAEGTVAEEDDAAEEEASENKDASEENPEKEFESLIKGKYKDAFHKRTQGIINDRFKSSKETEGKLKSAMEALAPLFDRFGIEEGDLEGITKAIQNDAGIFAKKALENGMDSEEYRDKFNAKRVKDAREAEEALEKRRAEAEKLYVKWRGEEAEIKKTYPAFSLEQALQNEDFKRMAMSGESLLNSYRASHFDEIAAGLVAASTQRAAKKTVDSMQANVMRAREGGMNASGGAVTVKDVNSLTGNDIDEIIKRVGRGETVAF